MVQPRGRSLLLRDGLAWRQAILLVGHHRPVIYKFMHGLGHQTLRPHRARSPFRIWLLRKDVSNTFEAIVRRRHQGSSLSIKTSVHDIFDGQVPTESLP